jgi:hypothetical protein
MIEFSCDISSDDFCDMPRELSRVFRHGYDVPVIISCDEDQGEPGGVEIRWDDESGGGVVDCGWWFWCSLSGRGGHILRGFESALAIEMDTDARCVAYAELAARDELQCVGCI